MGGIFINYRTGDDDYAAVALDQHLKEIFGAEAVFRDSRSLPPGKAFPPELWDRLRHSTVVLVLIGRRWLTLKDGKGRPKLENPDDYVRTEIREALVRDKYVIPVLLNGAKMPKSDQLPGDIAGLSERQGRTFNGRNDDYDLQRLTDDLARLVPRLQPRDTRQDSPAATIYATRSPMAFGKNASATYNENVAPRRVEQP
jgi:TIR domain